MRSLHQPPVQLAMISMVLLAALPAPALADQQVARLVGGCGPGTPGRSGASTAIPGDPQGRKGWRGDVETDDAGNKYEIWCIEIAGGVGNSFGQRYVPKAGNPVWVGRCAFIGGRNKDSKEPTGDADKDGNPDGWKKLTWTTRDPATGQDHDWEYDVAGNRLKRWETQNGTRIRPDTPDYDGPAFENFDNLMALQPANPAEDMSHRAAVAVALLNHTGTEWMYLLSGWTLDTFSPTLVMPGDSWSIAGVGIFSAQGPSDWRVDVSSRYVSWTYEGQTAFELDTLSGFAVHSSFSRAPGNSHWISISDDGDRANFGYAGLVAGPIPEPAPWLLLAAGVLASGLRRRLPGRRE